MAIKRISISQVASLVGLDAYNNFPRIVCELWRKYNPTDFKIYEAKLKSEGQQLATSNEMNDIWEADEALGTNILQQVKDLNSNKDKSSSDMVSQQEMIAKYINNNDKLAKLDIKEKEELTKKVCSITNKMHGVINEDSVLAEFCRLSEKTIKDTQGWVEIAIEGFSIEGFSPSSSLDEETKNSSSSLDEETKDTSSSLVINKEEAPQSKWVLVGKYDAITTDNELVEAKMRQKALFKKVRDYENVQVQLYLHALKLEQAYLVESYTNKKGEKQIYVNDVKYDESYVSETLLCNIAKFIEFFETYMMNSKDVGSSESTSDAKYIEIKTGLLKGDKDRKIYKLYEAAF